MTLTPITEHEAVAVDVGPSDYLELAPFAPEARYPELRGESVSPSPNPAYRAVRESLRLAGLDAERYDTPAWNPLGAYIRPGETVLLKPNLVKESHPRDPDGWRYVLTHGSVIRAVADYVFLALQGTGRVIVADAPQTDSSFRRIAALLHLDALTQHYRAQGLDFAVVDLRKEEWRNEAGAIVHRELLPGDPAGYAAFDLGGGSEFAGHRGEGRYYGADYDEGTVNRHHTGGRHAYLISGTAVRCDVFVNLPKLKTHKKAGVTVNLKNLVGINGDKNWLPHHTVGHPGNGGDQFPDFTLKREVEHRVATALRHLTLRVPRATKLLQLARRTGTKTFGDTETVVRSGNWYGNDTTWRMCLDLNKALLYGNADGTLRQPELAQRKRYLCFVDGIVAGDGSGPMNPDPVRAGALLFGTNPAVVDAASAVLVGFDPDRLPIVREAFHTRGWPITTGHWRDVVLRADRGGWAGTLDQVYRRGEVMSFAPHFGWVGHVESPHRRAKGEAA